jgi:hypothetical protein
MNKEIAESIYNANPTLSPMSITVYTNNIIKTLALLDLSESDSIITALLDYEEVIEALNNMYKNPNTLKLKYASIIVYLKSLKKANKKKLSNALIKYAEQIDALTETINNKLSTNKKSELESARWITEETKQTLLDKLESKIPEQITSPKDLIAFRNYVIYLFYSAGVPSRLDLADTKIYKDINPNKLTDEYNYIIVDTKNKKIKYIMNVYKTSKTYGQKVIELNDKLYNPIYHYYNAVSNFNKDNWFLIGEKLGKLSRNRLGTIYTNLGLDNINTHITVNNNRHQAVSDNIDIGKVKRLASMMGHSTSEALGVYAKE